MIARQNFRNSTALLLVIAGSPSACAESLRSGLALAYAGNPDLNQSLAAVRARDEDAPKTLAGMRPKASIQASAGPQYGNLRFPAGQSQTSGQRQFPLEEYVGYPRGASLNISQNVFDGARTFNSVRQAESNVFGSRATMRLTEQANLHNGANAYMNVLRDTAVMNLRKNNIAVLGQQLKQAQDRFQVGEATRTEVAQAEASLAQARSELYAARAQLKNSVANYHPIIDDEPKSLQPGRPIELLLLKAFDEAIHVALVEHPGEVSARHHVDAAELAVKVAESALSPTLSVNAQVLNHYHSFLGIPATLQFVAAASGQLNIPLSQGSAEYASIRQSKEQLLRQVQLNADQQRDSVHASVVSSYGLLETAKSSIISGQAAVKAAETALAGVLEKAKVGQRTTLDVLNAQQALLNARVSLVISQRDCVVASYAVLGSIGRLSAQDLNLDFALCDPAVHYEQVKTKWFGTDTTDGT